jgi:hypothetical protein
MKSGTSWYFTCPFAVQALAGIRPFEGVDEWAGEAISISATVRAANAETTPRMNRLAILVIIYLQGKIGRRLARGMWRRVNSS